MSEKKHSRGPWTVAPEEREMTYRMIHSGSFDVAQVGSSRGIKTAELEANAHLIAAAPELLAALSQILNDWDSIPCAEKVPDEINVDDHWESVRTAIAKATNSNIA